jgi:hypothetical protein
VRRPFDKLRITSEAASGTTGISQRWATIPLLIL